MNNHIESARKPQYFLEGVELVLPCKRILHRGDGHRALLVDGCTASGKTTFQTLLTQYLRLKNFNNIPIQLVETDCSLLTRKAREDGKKSPDWAGKIENYFDLESTTLPILRYLLTNTAAKSHEFKTYNHLTGERDNTLTILHPREFDHLIIVQGVFANSPKKRALTDLGICNLTSILVDSNPDACINRALTRAASRNRNPQEVEDEFRNIILPHWQRYSTTILPQIDIIVRSQDNKFSFHNKETGYPFNLNSLAGNAS